MRVHNPPAVREDKDMKKSGKLKCFLGVLTLMICLFLISPVYAMSEGHLRVATISGRAFQKDTCEKMTAIFKKTRIPTYKNSSNIYTYSYNTDSSKLKSKKEQKEVVNGINNTIRKAFAKSTNKDLNIFYYVGHGVPPTKENGYGGIPIGYYNTVFDIVSSKDNEKISFVELIKTLNLYKGKFIVIIDCCRAGALYNAASEELSESDLNRFMFLVSTDYKTDEFADQLSRSMISAINNEFIKADENRDGCLTLPELFAYLKRKHLVLFSYNKPSISSNNIDFFGDLPVFQFNYTKLSASSISLSKGKEQTLKTSIKGPKSIKHKLKYSSSNSRVASVDSKGRVTGKSSGTAIISVCLIDNKGQECISTKSSCVVKVYETTGIKLNSSSISLYVKDSTYISASVSGKSSKVTWKTSNSSVATVDSNGKVTGKKAGTCKITATANGKTAACTVTVKNRISANSAYKKLIQKYEAKYGKAKLYNSKSMHYWKGVCFAKLLDFNNDGTKELILAYQNGFGKVDKIKYHVELWTFDGKNTKKICSSVSWTGNNCEYFGGFSIIKSNGNYLLFLSDGAVGNDVYYGKKSNGTLGAVHSFHWKGDAMEGQWYYNGKAISVNDYINYYNRFHPNSNWYSFASEKFDKTIRSELAKTRKTLKL